MAHTDPIRSPLFLVPALRFSGLAGLVLLASASSAKDFSGYNSNAPVDYAADHIELLDKQDRVMLNGNVVITQDDMRLTSERGVVAYTNDAGVKIQRLDASGNVYVTRGDENARGDVAVYDFNQRIITMVGNVVLHRGSDVMYGSRLTVDLDSGLSRMDGRGIGGPVTAGGQGRVSGTFSVPKKNTSGSGDSQQGPSGH